MKLQFLCQKHLYIIGNKKLQMKNVDSFCEGMGILKNCMQNTLFCGGGTLTFWKSPMCSTCHPLINQLTTLSQMDRWYMKQ